MAYEKNSIKDNNLETLTVLTELRKVFENCDVNGLEEVEITPLINQMCLVLPVMENQEELRQKLFQLLTPSGEHTVKKQKFETSMMEWIEIVYGRNDCSVPAASCLQTGGYKGKTQCLGSHVPKPYNSYRAHLTRNKLRNKTSTPLSRTISCQEHLDDIAGDFELENEKSTSRNGSLNLKMENKEEVFTLRQRNSKLETMVDPNQMSPSENSPCKNCAVLQHKMDKLKRTIEKEMEANNKYCLELSNLIDYKDENQKLLHKIVIHKKTEENLQSKINELQIQTADLIDTLKLEQDKGERNMKLIIDLQQDKAEAEMFIENIEKKLMRTVAEIESLKEDNKSLEEYISTQRHHLNAPITIDEESCSVYMPVVEESPSSRTESTEVLSLLEELQSVVPPYGFNDVSTQTPALLGNNIFNEFETKIVKSFHEVNHSGRLEILVEDQEQEYFHQLQISRRMRGENRFSEWMFLCFIIIPLGIAFVIYLTRGIDPLSNYTELFCHIKFKFLKPPPL